MKIKITETQAKRLNLLKEDMNPLTNFEQYCKVKGDELNKLYINLTSTAIIDVINGEVKIPILVEMLNDIEANLYKLNSAAYKFISNLPESDLDLRIDNAQDIIDQKMNSISLILNALGELNEMVDGIKLTQPFDDIKPIDISGLQKD